MKTVHKRFLGLMTSVLMLLAAGCQMNAGNQAMVPENTVAETVTDIDEKHEIIEEIPEQTFFKLVEADGTELILDKPPERIVVLSVATAEIMVRLGIPLAGMTSTSRELSEELRGLPEVGIPMRPDMERIASLGTDLVIMSSVFKEAHKENFAQMNIPAFFIDNQRYTDTKASIKALAKAFGRDDRTEELLAPILERERAVLDAVKEREKPKVMVLFGTTESFSMARENSFVGEMVKILGAENITDNIPIGPDMASMIPLSIEQAVSFNPQIILRISHGNPRQVRQLYDKEFAENPVWSTISAVQNNRVYDLNMELFFSNPGLSAIDALEELAKILYP